MGRITGALVALLTVMKGLPLAYSKDMQEDKEQVFDAADALMLALAAMAGMVADMAPQAERLRAAAGAGFSTATDLADWLVRRLGLPFREAHHVTGALVRQAEEKGVDLAGAQHRGDAGGASGDFTGGLPVLRCGQLCGESCKLWWHGAGSGARAGTALAGGARVSGVLAPGGPLSGAGGAGGLRDQGRSRAARVRGAGRGVLRGRRRGKRKLGKGLPCTMPRLAV